MTPRSLKVSVSSCAFQRTFLTFISALALSTLSTLSPLSPISPLIPLSAQEAHAQLKVVSTSSPSEAHEAPYQLTTQDGTGLELISLKAKAIIDGPLAFTELHLTFKNPHNRQIEGRFEVTMPDRAALSRFAMKIRGAWMEGEVVEKQAARRAYEDALHRRQDPALLEQDAGNQFRARVFPIAPREEKELIISWSQELSLAGERYSLPLMGLPKMRELSLTAMVAKLNATSSVKSSLGGEASRYEVTTVNKTNFAPTQDWTLSGGEVAEHEGLRSGEVALARLTLPQASLASSEQPHMVVLFDSSASRMIGYEARVKRLEELASHLSELGVTRLSVVAFDQDAELIFDGAPNTLTPNVLKRLTERDALGASDFQVGVAQVKALLAQRQEDKPQATRLLLMGDGVFTSGPSQVAELKAVVQGELRPLGVSRVDAFVDQSARDMSALEALVTVEGVSPGKVLTLSEPLNKRLARLKAQTFGTLKVSVPGAKWTWPTTLKGLQPGDQALIYADLPTSAPLSVELSGGALTQPLKVALEARQVERPLIERAWVRARIERLMTKMESPDPDMKGVYREQIIKLSTTHRVLSSYTALVVLENEAMYRRFNIDRKALSEILVVGTQGLEVLKRAELSLPPPPPPPKPVTRRATTGRKGRRSPSKAKMKKRARRSTGNLTQSVSRGRPQDDFVGGAPPSEAPSAPPSPISEGMPMEEAEAEPMMEAPLAAPAPSIRPSSLSAMEAPELDDALPSRDEAPPPPAGVAERSVSALQAQPTPRREARRRSARRRPRPTPPRRRSNRADRARRQIKKGAPALTGVMAEVAELIKKGKNKQALTRAERWRADEPTNPLTLIALGLSLEANGNIKKAARAYGSVIDFFPSRADMRRLAGNWLETLGEAGLTLAETSYRVASEQRPDHPSVYHMWAMSLVKLNRHEEALEVALKGITARRVENRFREVGRILQEDAQLIASALAKRTPKRREELINTLKQHNLSLDERASTRFVLSWETDANDVDFHIYDNQGGHAFYSQKRLPSGGELYADITTGYGPECFTIYEPQAAPYRLQAHYFRRGPMGYGAGKLQVITHNGEGGLSFDERPFVIMNDRASVELGEVSRAGLKRALKR